MNNNQKHTKVELQEAVIRAIVFFDLFNYPLTRWEIWQNLMLEVELIDLEKIICVLFI